MSESFRALIVTDAEVEGVIEYSSASELEAFRDGLARGVSLSGCLWAGVYTLAEVEELQEGDRRDRKVAALLRKHREELQGE